MIIIDHCHEKKEEFWSFFVIMSRDLLLGLSDIQQDAWRSHFQERVEEVRVIFIMKIFNSIIKIVIGH